MARAPGRWVPAPRPGSAGREVVADPAGEAGLVDLAGGEAEDHHHGLGLVCDEIDVVEPQEGDQRSRSGLSLQQRLKVRERAVSRASLKA